MPAPDPKKNHPRRRVSCRVPQNRTQHRTPDARVALKQIDVGVASTINQSDVILLEGSRTQEADAGAFSWGPVRAFNTCVNTDRITLI